MASLHVFKQITGNYKKENSNFTLFSCVNHIIIIIIIITTLQHNIREHNWNFIDHETSLYNAKFYGQNESIVHCDKSNWNNC